MGAIITSIALWPVAASATPLLPTVGPVHLTAAPKKGLTVVLATVTNVSNKPMTIYRVTTKFAPAAMLHYDVNMCQKGNQMNVLPMVVIPPHRHITLSTKGVGVMLTPISHALRVGERVPISLTYAIDLRRQTLNLTADVIAPPKGLPSKPKKNSVG
jgi:copper(I)-binding protein